MRYTGTLIILGLFIGLPFLPANGQKTKAEDAARPETISISSIHSNGTFYFKSRIKGLEKDMQLILEKEVPEKDHPVVVDTQKGMGTQVDYPILYCFKDEEPDSEALLYRLRGITFDKGEANSFVLAEKRFDKLLLSMKEN